MEVANVLRMKGGTGETSYANNSYIQEQVLLMTRTMKEEAIEQMYNYILPTEALCIADLGCSCGPNTFTSMRHLIASICKLCKKLGHQPQEFQVYLNDLPENDFNNVFRSLKNFQENLKEEIWEESGYNYFFYGVPGSFYGRLFPANVLHFVHSSYSLMWLSQVPRGLEGNKRNIYMTETSQPSILRAYYEQFQRDFSSFLMCRSKELVIGGHMVLTILGRKSDDPANKTSCYCWDFLARALREVVAEGLVEEGKLDTFNVPIYYPSASEIDYEVQKEGSFTIQQINVFEVSCWNENEKKNDSLGHINNAYHDRNDYAKSIWSIAEPLLVSHFGEDIMEKVFLKFKEVIQDFGSEEGMKYVNVTISMMKKGASI